MSPEQLIERLESMGILDEKILAKLRREINNPDKTVKASQILRYLVKKGELTQAQADKVKAGLETPKPVVHEEIAEAAPVADGYDTDDLTANVEQPAPVPTASIQNDVVEASIEEEPDTADIVAAIPEPVAAAVVDPFADPYGAGMQSGGNPVEDGSGAYDPLSNSFSGKRYNPDQWQSRWLYIGFGILGTLLLFGAVLYIAVGRQSAEDSYKAITKSYADGALGDAIARADEFLEQFPRDEYAPKVTTLRVNAIIAQKFNEKSFVETLNQTELLVPPLIDDEKLDLSVLRQDLGIFLPKCALQLTEVGLRQTTIPDMEKELEQSEWALGIASNPTFVLGSDQKRNGALYQQIKDNILLIKERIVKENMYVETLKTIAERRELGETDEAFQAYRKLTRKYGDLAARSDLRDEMVKVSIRERDLVKQVDLNLETATSEPPAPGQTIVLAGKNGEALPALIGEVTPVMAEGTLYGIDVGDGSVKWRRFVGFETRIQPVSLGKDYLVVSDQRRHELLCVGRTNNELRWKLAVGEEFVEPVLSEEFMVVTTRSGKVIKVNHVSGEVMAACQLPQGTNVSALIAPRDPYIYQVGSYSNLYILNAADLSCKDVFYVGHQEGAIQVPPVYWSGHMLLAVNGGASAMLEVLKGEKGLDLKQVQVFPGLTSAPVTMPMQRIARGMMVLAENGDLKVLTINPIEETTPVDVMVQYKLETSNNTGMQVLATKSTLFFAGKGILRARLKSSQSLFQKPLILNHADSFIAPMAVYDDTLIHVRRRDGSKMISVSAVDTLELKPIWRTDLGGPLAGSPVVTDDSIRVASSQGDFFSVTPGQQVADDRLKSSTILENLLFSDRIRLADGREAFVGPSERLDLLVVDPVKKESQLNQMRINEGGATGNRASCKPISLGKDLIVPTTNGAVMRVDSGTGELVGTPFLPPVQPGTKQEWRRPVQIGEGVFAIAKTNQGGAGSTAYVLDGRKRGALVATTEKEFQTVVSDLVALSTDVFLIVQGDASQKLLKLDAGAELAEKASAALSGDLVEGPYIVGEQILVVTDEDKLFCFDANLQPQWSVPVPAIRMAGEPVVMGNGILLAFENGQCVTLSQSDGSETRNVSLNQPITGTPVVGSGQVYFGGLDGTVHVVPMSN